MAFTHKLKWWTTLFFEGNESYLPMSTQEFSNNNIRKRIAERATIIPRRRKHTAEANNVEKVDKSSLSLEGKATYTCCSFPSNGAESAWILHCKTTCVSFRVLSRKQSTGKTFRKATPQTMCTSWFSAKESGVDSAWKARQGKAREGKQNTSFLTLSKARIKVGSKNIWNLEPTPQADRQLLPGSRLSLGWSELLMPEHRYPTAHHRHCLLKKVQVESSLDHKS